MRCVRLRLVMPGMTALSIGTSSADPIVKCMRRVQCIEGERMCKRTLAPMWLCGWRCTRVVLSPTCAVHVCTSPLSTSTAVHVNCVLSSEAGWYSATLLAFHSCMRHARVAGRDSMSMSTKPGKVQACEQQRPPPCVNRTAGASTI